MRAYKSLKAFKFFEEGYVQKISSLVKDSRFIVRSEVMASMAQKVYKAYVCLSTSGDVEGGSCDCVAGKGEACSHIAALLFAIDDFISKGLKELPADQTGTDKLCTWNRPARRKIEPKTIHNIRIVKNMGKTRRKGRHFLACILILDIKKTKDEESFQKLCEALDTANPTCGFMKFNRKIIETDNQHDTHSIPTVKHCTDITLPPSINDIREAGTFFTETLTLDENGIVDLEMRTRGQSTSSLWHRARKYRLTASTFHKIGSRRKKTDPSNLLMTLLYDNRKSTRDMLFGLQQETASTERFIKEMERKGVSGVTVEKRGLIVHSEYPYLGASVDGVVQINGNEYVLELKNPASTRKMNLESAAKKPQCLKIDENNDVYLNPKHNYYSQVQGQMAVTKMSKCYFVLCTQMDIHVEMIEFDEQFWNVLLQKLTSFYSNIFLPEVIYPSVKFGLPPLDLSSHAG